MTLTELKRQLRRMAYQCGYNAERCRYDSRRDRGLGRQEAFTEAAEMLEQLDPDEVRARQ